MKAMNDGWHGSCKFWWLEMKPLATKDPKSKANDRKKGHNQLKIMTWDKAISLAKAAWNY